MNLRSLLVAALLAVPFASLAALDPTPTPRRAPPLSVSGAPRSLVTLVVAVPAEFADVDRVTYEVVLSGTVSVLGRLSGELEMEGADRLRPLMLTLRVPSSALVGLMDVADVVFVDRSGRSVIVPIILRVPAVRSVLVTGLREVRDLAPGDRVEVSYRVQNLGNASEQLRVQLLGAAAWNPRVIEGDVQAIPAYGETTITVALRVPALDGGGAYPLGLALLRDPAAERDSVAGARTLLRVREVSPRLPGLALRPYVGVGTASDGSSAAAGFRLDGPVGERTNLLVDVATRPSGNGQSIIGLSGLGAIRAPFQAQLSGEDWAVTAGNASTDFGELSGMSPNGNGVAARAPLRGVEVEALLAQPFSGLGASGHMLGARAKMPTALGTWAFAATSLREDNRFFAAASRNLNAVGVALVADPRGDFTGEAGLSLRDHSAGTGLGYQFRAGRETSRSSLSLSFLRAPGGVQAYAPATDRWTVDARRSLGDRLSLFGSAQRMRDGGAVLRSIEGRNASLGAQYALTAATSLELRGSSSSSLVRSSSVLSGQFGSRERGVSTQLATGWTRWRVTAAFRLAEVERVTALLSGAESNVATLQRSSTLSVSHVLEGLGVLAMNSGLIETGRGVGAPAWLMTHSLRWSDIAIPIVGEVFRFESEVSSITSAVDRPRLGARGAVATNLRSGLEVSASLERNPFLVDRDGRVGLIAALRIGISSSALGSVRRNTERVIFLDADADGVRDEGERGVPGVVVRFDSYRFVSSRNGTFKVPSSLRGRLRVDASTLPSGLVLHPKFVADTLERLEIPLVPTARVVVELFLQPDDEGRVPSVDLGQADVWLRDAEGFEWVGQYSEPGRFTFADVPVGTYIMRTSTSRMAEPVRLEEQRLVLKAGDDTVVKVPVRGRTIRIITPPRQGGGRGGVAPRGGAFTPRGGVRQ